MAEGARATATFYGTARGMTAARLLRERLALMWPDLRGQSLLGFGYAGPYLATWQTQAARCVGLNPGPPSGLRAGEFGPVCAGEEHALPFPDLCFDRVLIVHGLEAAESPPRMLREAWRVLKDDGRLMIVAPVRGGLWALSKRTPFGGGRPCSTRRLERLLAASMFRVERTDRALYAPPMLFGAADVIERAGRAWAPRLGGVTIAEAVKDCYGAIPLVRPARRRVVLLEAA